MIRGFVCLNPREQLKPFSYDPGAMTEREVEVRITHCGICHSDIHLIDDDWGMSAYPFIPGHEIVGIVTAKGSATRGLEVGQRVGIGWQRDSCGACRYCRNGNENLCAHQAATCVGHHGGYAASIRVDHRFAIPIPEELDSEATAPLLCGGITVYSPFLTHGITARHRVGVVGIGGLGHLALQFARAFGCHVTALSRSESKKAEATSFGADRFIMTNDVPAMKAAAQSLDMILSTVSGDVSFPSLLPLLRPDGKICILGASSNPLNIPASALISGRLTLCGSNIGSPGEIRDMLAFAARKGIRARTEAVPMPDVNAALDKVRANKARYRMVLKN